MSLNYCDPRVKEVIADEETLYKVAKEKYGAWPELEEPSLGCEKGPSYTERVTLWTMAGVLGSVTIYAIATGDREVLLAVLGIAAGAFIRLGYYGHKWQKENYDSRRSKRTSSE